MRAGVDAPYDNPYSKILHEGTWPNYWRLHWIQPLHKRESRADPGKYRGVHLTAQVSKVVERAIGHTFLPWARKENVYGENQYAYTTARSHKDALAANVCSWLLKLEEGKVLALYCSDVSGAFDRVRKSRIIAKLRKSGLHPKVVRFLESWLDDRTCSVVVGGQCSDPRVLRNSVFQGTVLGPPLWNIFYRDASNATSRLEFIEVVFADDLNCTREFPAGTSCEECLDALDKCQRILHTWGRANSVTFNSTKEGFHILHRRIGSGGNFRILGVTFDVGLLMDEAIAEIAKEAGWRLRDLLRPRRFLRGTKDN